MQISSPNGNTQSKDPHAAFCEKNMNSLFCIVGCKIRLTFDKVSKSWVSLPFCAVAAARWRLCTVKLCDIEIKKITSVDEAQKIYE